MAKKLYGVFAVIVTPFTNDDKIDEEKLRKHVRYLIDEGKVHAIIPTGGTDDPCTCDNDFIAFGHSIPQQNLSFGSKYNVARETTWASARM